MLNNTKRSTVNISSLIYTQLFFSVTIVFFLVVITGCTKESINVITPRSNKDRFALHATWNKINEVKDLKINLVRGFYNFHNNVNIGNWLTLYQRDNIDFVITLQPKNINWGNDVIGHIIEQNPNTIAPLMFSGFPSDIEAYKSDLRNFIERLDGDGIDDFPELLFPVNFFQIDNEVFWAWFGNPPSEIDNIEELINWRTQNINEVYVSYGEFLKITSNIIREANPNASIILGDIFEPNVTNPITENKRLILEAYNDYFDIIDIHFYGDNEELELELSKLNELKIFNKSIWFMELGGPMKDEIFNSEDNKLHSSEIIKMHLTSCVWGSDKVFWSSLVPTIGWPQSFLNTALLYENGEKKPAYYTYKLLVDKINNSLKIVQLDEGFYKISFKNKPPVFVIWNEQNNKIVDVTPFVNTDKVKITHIVVEEGITTPEIEIAFSNNVSTGTIPVFIELNY